MKVAINSSPANLHTKLAFFLTFPVETRREAQGHQEPAPFRREPVPVLALPAVPGREPARSQDICCPLPPSRQTASHRRPRETAVLGKTPLGRGHLHYVTLFYKLTKLILQPLQRLQPVPAGHARIMNSREPNVSVVET